MNKEPSEIAKLTERISKDPKSKLFVPLAEEYKRAGDIEMAVHVLVEGLKNNPSYVTARSFLGKLLIEQGSLMEAQKEFEEVIKAIPDNLMAQRKLGDLYVLQNRPAEALKHYKAVLAINPKDSETGMLISEAEAGRDIRTLIPGPKVTAASSSAPAVKQETSQPQPGPVSKQAPSAPAVPASAAAPVISRIVPEEEAEEVLAVEPLLPEEIVPPAAFHEPSPGGFDFLAESDAPVSTESDASGAGEAFDQTEQAPAGQNAAPAGDEGRFASFEEAPSVADPFALSEEPGHAFATPPLELGEPFAETSAAPMEVPPLGSTEPFGLAEDSSVIMPGSILDADPFGDVARTASPEEELIEAFVMDDQPVITEPAATAEEEPIEAFVMDDQPAVTEQAAAEEEPIEAIVMDDQPAVPVQAAAEEEPIEAFVLDDQPAITEAAAVEESPIEAFLMDELPRGANEALLAGGPPEIEPEKQGDDFTTDTLAELYISQGFFEKAIDIYERMLADHPNSTGLKDKLTHVRAMASASEQDADGGGSHLAGEAETGERPGDETAASPGADVFIPPSPGFGQPRLDDWELPATKPTPASTDAASSRPVRQPKPFDLGFEPREYVPPDALPRKGGALDRNAAQAAAGPVSAAGSPGAEPTDRKETVERLESWLKNIMKET